MSRKARSLTTPGPSRLATAEGPGADSPPYHMFAYWLMPHGLRGLLTTVFWPTAKRPTLRSRPGRTTYPGPTLPFLVLAPGKVGRQVGEHTFWRGSLWGRTVALQGDSSFTKYDLFELTDTELLYWGTFRGNGFYGSEESHSFSAPFGWMNRWMGIGDFTQQPVTDTLMDPRLRKEGSSGELALRVEVVAHYPSWSDPDSGIEYRDVLEVHYWSRYPDPSSREVYHLAKWLGTIRFETSNSGEPSGVRYQYAEYFERFSPPDQPTLPWFDPFGNATHVPNGFFEDLVQPPEQGGAVGAYMKGWSGSPDAVITTDPPDEGTGPWAVALRGESGGGDTTADFVIASDWIPVSPGGRYRLSGSLWRTSEDDNVYLDFNDGRGQGEDFPDAQALASRVHVWERVAAETTVGPQTTALKVRCVRNGANRGNAYCDGITLQRLG
jgi:hypothetical protein